MNNQVNIPQGNEQVEIHLTVKELMALSGERFNQDHKLLIEARKKLRQQLESQTKSVHH
jgi:hypothetical protein